jgi:DNA-3-methyladenine glycosylase
MASATSSKATPIATKSSQHLPQSFFARPAELVAPELIGCLLVKRQRSRQVPLGLKDAEAIG